MFTSMKQKLLAENAVKHLIALALLYFSYSPLEHFITSLNTDSIGEQTIIILSSLLIMAFLFGTYTFTFKDSNMTKSGRRTLDYLQTGITLFGCGALLEISYLAINAQIHTTFSFMGMLMILFYISLALFDFSDLARNPLYKS